MKARAVQSFVMAAFVGVALVASGCSVMRGQESGGAYVSDSTITAKVKAKLVGSSIVDAGAVSVDTLHGEVSLSGYAVSKEEKKRAAQLARSVDGVTAVHNNLIVRKPSSQANNDSSQSANN